MLRLCEKQAQELHLTFNSKTSCKFKVDVSFNETLDNLKLNGCDVYWVDKLRYLGVFIVQDRVFKIDTYWITRKFYAGANAICCHTKNVQELSRLHLFEAFTLPMLTYGCDGILFSGRTCRK